MPKFGLPPIECEYGFPNCLSGISWGGHVNIPYPIAPPPMQVYTGGYSNPRGGGSGIIQTIIQAMNQQTSKSNTTNCSCTNTSSEAVCMCTQGTPNTTPSNVATNIIEQAKTFATAHPLITLAAVVGVGYALFKD